LSIRVMDSEPDSWIETPAFNWTPEVPLRVEPKFEGALPADLEISEPQIFNPKLEIPALAAERPAASTTRERVTHYVVVVPEARPTPLFLPRLLVGLGQGAALSLLFASRAAMDPY